MRSAKANLYRAAAANNAQQNGYYSNDQQNVNQAIASNTGTQNSEVAQGPKDDENDSDEIQQVAHD